MNVETALLGISILFFLSILACKAGYKFGVPLLLLFLGVGMLCGTDGLDVFRGSVMNLGIAQGIGTVALCVILFSGGLDTKFSDIRPVLGPGLVLATLGVVLTAVLTGFLIHLVFNIPAFGTIPLSLTASLLLASTMSSTDSASVFSILRGKGLHLKNNLRPMLELESGSNDPMAYMLTITLIGLMQQGGEPDYGAAIGSLFKQFAIGAIAGVIFGKAFVWIINRLQIENASLYPIVVLTTCIFMFGATYQIGGNSYLAVYIGGVVVGNESFVHKRSSVNFFDGLAWLSQLLVFLTLGLLVNPHELVPLIIPGIIISILMIFVTRPVGVFLCLLPFRKISNDSRLFVSWVGLRGAVPIIFAILALAADVPHARFIFNVVFVCTLVSLIVQGTSLAWMAKKLNLLDKSPDERGKVKDFDDEFSEGMKSMLAELTITDEVLEHGSNIMDLKLPDSCTAVLHKHGEEYLVPDATRELAKGDKVLFITNDREDLMNKLSEKGIGAHDDNNKTNDTPDTNPNIFSQVTGQVKEFVKSSIKAVRDIPDSFKNGKFMKF